MNKVDPVEVLSNHAELCERLRQDLEIDGTTRCYEQLQEETAAGAEDSGAYCSAGTPITFLKYSIPNDKWTFALKLDNSRASRGYADEDSESSDSQSETESLSDENLQPRSTADQDPPVEESWDDEPFSDPDLSELQQEIPPNMASKYDTFDGHLFIPSVLHSSSYCRPHNDFPIIEGQFDDDDDDD